MILDFIQDAHEFERNKGSIPVLELPYHYLIPKELDSAWGKTVKDRVQVRFGCSQYYSL